MKIKKNKNDQEFFSEFLKYIPNKVKNFVRISMDIATQINYYLNQKNLTQRELAAKLGKKESEISKWLSGNHNFTIKTIANIEEAIGEEIISVPLFAKKEIKLIHVQSYSEKLNISMPDTPFFAFSDSTIKYNLDNHIQINPTSLSNTYGTTIR